MFLANNANIKKIPPNNRMAPESSPNSPLIYPRTIKLDRIIISHRISSGDTDDMEEFFLIFYLKLLFY